MASLNLFKFSAASAIAASLGLLGSVADKAQASEAIPRSCPAPYDAFTYTQAFNFDPTSAIITATFTPSSSNDAKYKLHHVQLHASKNCDHYINNNLGPDSDKYPGTLPVTLGSSTSVCPSTWYQPPFDYDPNVDQGFVPQNYLAGSDGVESHPKAGEHAVYVASTNTYTFHLDASILNYDSTKDTFCYDFTYVFLADDGNPGVGCDTGICIPFTVPPTQPYVPPSVHGDPQFTGFQGQEFQVHGVAGSVYNIFSNENLQMNSQFVFLNEGQCDKSLNTLCFGHPGSYIGALGIEYKADSHSNTTRILIQSGRYNQGLTVQLNGNVLAVSGKTINANGIIIRRTHQAKIHIHAPQLAVSVTNSDRFLNLDLDLADEFLSEDAIHSCEWPSSAEYDEPHGLMGQTWCLREMVSHKVEGEIDDYAVTDGLFGKKFQYNKF